ncbi:hypothetical protein BH24ACT9_BH24ACT9_16970 [soil metagenome]
MDVSRLVVFLRAINVGGHNVKMEHLRSLITGYGFSAVETFIASGNVIVDGGRRTPADDFAFVGRELHWLVREGFQTGSPMLRWCVWHRARAHPATSRPFASWPRSTPLDRPAVATYGAQP